MAKLLVAVGLSLSICMAASAPSMARSTATRCGGAVIQDWYNDGRVQGAYPVSCYRTALADIPSGNPVYGTVRTDLASALSSGLDRLRQKGVAPGPRTVLPAPTTRFAAAATTTQTESHRALSLVAMALLVALLALWFLARRRRVRL
jgi:hypothetical protein